MFWGPGCRLSAHIQCACRPDGWVGIADAAVELVGVPPGVVLLVHEAHHCLLVPLGHGAALLGHRRHDEQLRDWRRVQPDEGVLTGILPCAVQDLPQRRVLHTLSPDIGSSPGTRLLRSGSAKSTASAFRRFCHLDRQAVGSQLEQTRGCRSSRLM